MKPFKVNRDSWHYKLNKNVLNENGFDRMERWEYTHNNFCSYWRSTMIRLCFVAIFVSAALFILSAIGMAIYNNPWEAFKVISITLGAFTFVIGIVLTAIVLDERKNLKKKSAKPDSLFVAKYKSYKSKVCPSVEYSKE
jgi:hypothetical protein